MQIRYLKHKEIDLKKWDDCINKSSNSLVYAYSWYLNAVSHGWEALVSDDYSYVMPLTVKRRFGFPFILQPLLTQQLGIFSSNPVDENIIKEFIRKIPYFSYHINLNEHNKYSEPVSRPNYILDLNKVYELLYNAYSKNTKRNVQKAKEAGLYIKTGLSEEGFIDFYYSEITKKHPKPPKQFVKGLINTLKKHSVVELYAVYTVDDELISVLALLNSNKRLTYLLPYSSDKGKDTFAMFMLVDEIIRRYADKDYILDFEGSGVAGIARFYKGFGAIYKPYYEVYKHSMRLLLQRIHLQGMFF